MIFVGLDLTSAFARQPRAIDVAVLDDALTCRFALARWPAAAQVTARDVAALRGMLSTAIDDEAPQVWAVDGPQGLATVGQKMRHCERLLGTPGKTPDTLPAAASGGRPFGDYIRSSVDLFASLIAAPADHQLAGLGTGLSNSSLYETFPGSDWRVLAGQGLPHKESNAGRAARRLLMSGLGVRGLPTLPTADENDALACAYLAWCTRHAPTVVELRGVPPVHAAGELREGYILHAAKVPNANVTASDRDVVAVHNDAPDAPATSTPAEDWCSSEGPLLKLTDYGVVHGTCLENAWLDPTVGSYACETLAPDAPERFQLTHSPTFSGGRGWTASPKIKPLLAMLGYSTPDHLGEANAVTLRIRVI